MFDIQTPYTGENIIKLKYQASSVETEFLNVRISPQNPQMMINGPEKSVK